MRPTRLELALLTKPELESGALTTRPQTLRILEMSCVYWLYITRLLHCTGLRVIRSVFEWPFSQFFSNWNEFDSYFTPIRCRSTFNVSSNWSNSQSFTTTCIIFDERSTEWCSFDDWVRIKCTKNAADHLLTGRLIKVSIHWWESGLICCGWIDKIKMGTM